MEIYKTQDFSNLLGLTGFSEKALNIHFALYEGYVKNTNKILETLEKMRAENKTDSPEYAELKRRLGWEFDGMRLHEYYFSSLGGNGQFDEKSDLGRAMKKSFGSFDGWKKDFMAMAKMRGIGWAALYQDPRNGNLINFWIGEHDAGHPASLNLIIVLDLFEHAFMLDHGTNKGEYAENFMQNLKWEEIEKRLKN